MTYHGKEILPHYLSVLSNFPETTTPFDYRSLLPEAGYVFFSSLNLPFVVVLIDDNFIFVANEKNASSLSPRNTTVFFPDDPYWISRKNSLELIELSSISKVSLV